MHVLIMLLQLEMYQTQHQQHHQHQQTTVVMQPTVPVQPVIYAVPQAPVICENYDSGQSMVIGIILIVSGALSIIFNILGIAFVEIMAYAGHGFWCGIMVSLSIF